MIQNIIYAKKVVLPSTQANVIQSLQMAVAFSATGLPAFFYPGLNARKFHTKPGARPEKSGTGGSSAAGLLSELLALAGIGELPEQWRLLDAKHKGLYSLNFRLRAAADIHGRPNALLYARDVKEASFVAGMRSLPVLGGKDSRFIFEMHEALFLQHRDLEKRHDWRKTLELERSVLRRADGLVVTNLDIADIAAAELGYTGPVAEEPNGINESIFHALELFTDQVPWPGENGTVNLVYVGNMQQGKGVRELLAAMRLLPERFRLKIIGGGKATLNEVDEIIAGIPQGRQRVTLTGHIPQGQIREQCAGAHISVIPQQENGGYFSPLKLNESLALGLPIICTPLRVFERRKELMHQSESCAPKALSKAILELAGNPELAARLRARGLEEAAKLTWKSRASRILEFAQGL